MYKHRRMGIFLGVALLLMVFGINADAATRTFVSSTGTDAGTCPRATPCAGIAYALTQTDAGGTVVILDTTAVGGATINQSVTIEAVPGEQGLVKVQPSTTGITVSAGSLVVLKNLRIEGFGGVSTIGVSQNGGGLVIRDCEFTGLTIGILVVNAKMDLINSDLFGNGTAVSASGTGTDGQLSNVSTTQVRIAFGNVIRNTVGLKQVNPGMGFFNIWFFSTGNQGSPNVVGNTTGIQTCTPGCVTIQNIQLFGPGTILP